MADQDQGLAEQWLGFDEARRTSLLQKMDATQKKNLRTSIEAYQAQGKPAAPAQDDFTSNTKGEGLYPMSGILGDIQVPFSKVMPASQAGYKVSQDTRNRYRKDAQADWWNKHKTDPDALKRGGGAQPLAPTISPAPGGVGPTTSAAPLMTDADVPLPDVIPEGPGWWQRTRDFVGDITKPTSATVGPPTLQPFDPATGEMTLNAVKRLGANVFGLADMPVQAVQGTREMASGDPALGQVGQERLLGLTPQAQIVGRTQQAYAERGQPSVEAGNILGDVATAVTVPKATEYSLEQMRRVPGFMREKAQTVMGIGPERTRRAVEDEITRLRAEKDDLSHANADILEKWLGDVDKAKSEDELRMADHNRAVAETEARNNVRIAEHQDKLRELHDRNAQKTEQHRRDTEDVHSRNAEKTGEYHRKVQDVKDENAAKVSEHQADRQKAEQDWQALNQAHEQGLEHGRSRTDFEKQVNSDIKALEKKVYEAADAKYTDLRNKMADASIPREDAAKAVENAYRAVRGSPDTIRQFKFIADMEKGAPTLSWNDLQGYLEEFRKFKSADSDLNLAVKSMEGFIEGEMGKLAEGRGLGQEWTDAQASWAKFRQTFHGKKSPVAAAYRARTGPEAARPFLGRERLEQDPAIASLRDYDPALAARLYRLRELHGAAESAPGAPKPLASAEPPTLKDPEEVKPPKLEEPPPPPKLEDPAALAPPKLESSPKIPSGPNVPRPKLKGPEERVLDVQELKRQTIRHTAREMSSLKPGDLYFLVGGPVGFALAGHPVMGVLADLGYIVTKKMIAANIDTPRVLEWLSKPTRRDLEALQALPPEARDAARAKIQGFIDQQKGPVKIDPAVRAFLGTGGMAGNQAEQRAREAVRRLQQTMPDEETVGVQ